MSFLDSLGTIGSGNTDWGGLLSGGLQIGGGLYANNQLSNAVPRIPNINFNQALGMLDPNRSYTTGNSTMQNGRVTFDPSIRAGLNTAMTNANSLYSQYAGNNNAFVQARVQPLQDRLALRQAELRRSLGQRQVFGSFANQDMNNLDMQGQQEIGNAAAQANQEALQAGQGINQDIANISNAKFAQELQGLNLSATTINSLLSLAAQMSGASANANVANGQNTMAGAVGQGNLLGNVLNSLTGGAGTVGSIGSSVLGGGSSGGSLVGSALGNSSLGIGDAAAVGSATAAGNGTWADLSAGPNQISASAPNNVLGGNSFSSITAGMTPSELSAFNAAGGVGAMGAFSAGGFNASALNTAMGMPANTLMSSTGSALGSTAPASTSMLGTAGSILGAIGIGAAVFSAVQYLSSDTGPFGTGGDVPLNKALGAIADGSRLHGYADPQSLLIDQLAGGKEIDSWLHDTVSRPQDRAGLLLGLIKTGAIPPTALNQWHVDAMPDKGIKAYTGSFWDWPGLITAQNNSTIGGFSGTHDKTSQGMMSMVAQIASPSGSSTPILTEQNKPGAIALLSAIAQNSTNAAIKQEALSNLAKLGVAPPAQSPTTQIPTTPTTGLA